MENIFRQRAFTYNLISKLYLKEIDEQMLDILKSFDYSNFNEDTELDKGFQMLNAALAENSPFMLLNLAREYSRSFLGAGLAKNEGAYPYESVYTSKDHLLMQEARDAVVQCYQGERIGRSNTFKEPEDHIAFEMEFMAHLCTKAAETLATGDKAGAEKYWIKQQEFFNDHLNLWVPRFCDDLEKISKEKFYKAAAVITRAFIGEENEILNEKAGCLPG